ncbi:MAG: flagellar filament capping protein FliD, partial [Bacteroidaceae bacterium]|nr:flagellar filament capping protein FliD [Bacteroidaceae bacterium]
QTTGNAEGVNYATKIDGSDAEITLNGAKFKSSSNVFNINGLTITAMGTTEKGEEITLTTTNDTSGIYDSIKNFIKTYNNVINKLDKFYNAENVSKKNPLTDEEKDALSETEAEKYTEKLKDGLLSGDSNLREIINSLSSAMTAGYKVGDKDMYLSAFGIGTLDYFASAENEKHALHIDGDVDDGETSGNEDKLKAMIAKDPESLVSFFSQMANGLYQNMNKLSASVKDYRSFGSFYDDKKMKTDYTDYTTKITDLEKKLNDYEDKLYRQYGAMEKTLAKMQSNTSALAGLFGGN